MPTVISEVRRGDWFVWQGIELLVTRVSRDGAWADLRCKQLGTGYEWRKRQRLPLPEGTERRAIVKRPWTPDVKTETGKRITLKRACNGCGETVGDATLIEIDAGMNGQPLPDVRGECPRCCPVHAGGAS